MMLPKGQAKPVNFMVRLNPADKDKSVGKVNWTWVVGETLGLYSITGSFWGDWGKFLLELLDEKMRK
jgi:hypothetical protein